jgi:hypothetical protein
MKLLASAGSLGALRQLIERFWPATKIVLDKTGANTWSVANSRGVVGGFRVVEVRGRYRFEYTEDK